MAKDDGFFSDLGGFFTDAGIILILMFFGFFIVYFIGHYLLKFWRINIYTKIILIVVIFGLYVVGALTELK